MITYCYRYLTAPKNTLLRILIALALIVTAAIITGARAAHAADFPAATAVPANGNRALSVVGMLFTLALPALFLVLLRPMRSGNGKVSGLSLRNPKKV